jgi:hypothetical protein
MRIPPLIRLVLTLVLVSSAGLPAQRFVIDGRLDDRIWQHVRPSTLAPGEAGVPADAGGNVRAAVAGGYLYLGAHLPEPGGQVVAQSIGVDPVWEGGDHARHLKYPRVTFGAPNGEDFVRFVLFVHNGGEWALQAGPFGAYSVGWRWSGEDEWYNGDPEKASRFLVASAIRKDEWSVEAAIPLVEIGSPGPDDIRLRVERNRAERPNAPTQSWIWPDNQPSAGVAVISLADQETGDISTVIQPAHTRKCRTSHSGWLLEGTPSAGFDLD